MPEKTRILLREVRLETGVKYPRTVVIRPVNIRWASEPQAEDLLEGPTVV